MFYLIKYQYMTRQKNAKATLIYLSLSIIGIEKNHIASMKK